MRPVPAAVGKPNPVSRVIDAAQAAGWSVTRLTRSGYEWLVITKGGEQDVRVQLHQARPAVRLGYVGSQITTKSKDVVAYLRGERPEWRPEEER